MKTKTNKVLHVVAGRPMLFHVLAALSAVDADRIVLVVGHEAGQVRQSLGDRYECVEQVPQLGTGHAVLQAREVLRDRVDDVLVLYGDTPLLRGETLRRLKELHLQSGDAVTMLTAMAEEPTGYGRILRNGELILSVVEERAASAEQRAIREINSGVYFFDGKWLWENLDRLKLTETGEYCLTDAVGLAAGQGRSVRALTIGDAQEAMGINDRVQLAEAESVLRWRTRKRLMLSGVTLVDPAQVFADHDVEVGQDSIVYPGTVLTGDTKIGERSLIGPNTLVRDSVIGSDCTIFVSIVEDSSVGDRVTIGPFSHIRSGAQLAADVHLGNFAEVKSSSLGERTKMGHFSYIGDAQVGTDVNVGAGTITCNYDSETNGKARTTIGDRVALGSDTMLVAPVSVGEGSVTGAGSVVTRDVSPESVVLGVPAKLVRKTRRSRGTVGG